MRSIRKIYPAYREDIGDLTTRRPVPGPGVDQVDPFLFLNHHGPQVYRPGNRGLPFGPHPHRGFETVTFILEGSLAHHDTGGHESIIEEGGVQWMTAGSGLIHAEVSPPDFKRDGGPLEILQLWVNLPSRLKMTSPRYSGVQTGQIPKLPLAEGKGQLELISGDYADAVGPIRSLTGIFMSVVRLSAGASVSLPAPRGRRVFLYLVKGDALIAGQSVQEWHLIDLNDDGDDFAVAASTDCILLFGHGDPIDEPVVAHGPFVMNTVPEIHQAIRDYQAGAFNGTGKLLEIGD